ncbi:MAG: hypothetical protein A3J75_04890 [Acidobacteria bacterium RBG_16_68_9]|nr:MAG: hypothetical protein A3J75_04890 [Acidobacteria bacterium RBG_16_68_9]
MLENFRIVLVRPRDAGNVGAAARAMKNMGVTDLALVGPPPRHDFWATALAVHARDVMDRSSRFATLPAAVADCHIVVGTTSRGSGYRKGAESIEVMAPALVPHARQGRVALVFGPEDHGLSNADLKHCQRLATIPTADAYPSLNVAQAVLLCCYELRRALRPEAEASVAGVFAAAGDVAFMLERLQKAFLRIGFLHPDNPDHIMFAVRGLFGRAGLTPREVRILLGLARQIEWYARQRPVTRPAPRVSGDS